MKIVERYCTRCHKLTRHTHEKETTGAVRLFFGVLTLGIAEAVNENIYQCGTCGKKTVKLP